MPFYKECEYAEKEIKKMKKAIEDGTFEERYIRELVANQKGMVEVESKYYKGNIAEANWSLIDKDSDIEKLDKEKIEDKAVDALDIIYELEDKKEYTRENCAEYEYVFIPSYYAVKTLIIHYLNNKMEAEKVYGLKNAVVRRYREKFYGGLPFILKYMKKPDLDEHTKRDFAELMQKLFDCKSQKNINDDFINDIVDCIRSSSCTKFILEKRIMDLKKAKDEDLIEYMIVDDYKILMHNDVDKDWSHLKKGEIEKVEQKIRKTPKHPNNNSPKDSEALRGDLKGWFSQRISKKDRLVYSIVRKEKKVYIATVCDHYKNATRRIKTTAAYK